MTPAPLRLTLASPCGARWEDMTGDERKRLCALCNKHVFNLGGLTRPQVDALLDRDGEMCVRFFEREDGTVLTEDCPLGLARRAMRFGRRAWVATGALVATAIGMLGVGTVADTCDAPEVSPLSRVSGPPLVVPAPPQIPPIDRSPPRLEPLARRRMGTLQIVRNTNSGGR